jgi:class 3 adenylate cyclase/tetratricopeptide (TPR) repeat protein
MSVATPLAVNATPARRAGGAFDNPEAWIPGDRRRALASGVDMPDHVRGAALFADISGFTPLTEALAAELGPQRGAEELTLHLNRVFQALIDALARFGGHVICFSGDAITCWLDADDGLRATACGLAMQEALHRQSDVVTPGGLRVRLAMKIAVAVGPARRFVVGDPAIQLIDVLAGRLIDTLAVTEQQALPDEVVLAASALDALTGRVSARPRGEANGGAYGIVERVLAPVDPLVPEAPASPLPLATVEAWLLPDVHARLRVGRAEFLAELRPAFPLFVRFGGIDYDHDDDAMAKLDAFVRHAQRIVTGCGGNVLQLTLGDKGAYLYAVFGSPFAHEDDAARAASAALELRALDAATAVRDIQVGIAYGRLRSGMYGHADRQTFTCLGAAVNMAARLMSAAPPGEIYVTEPVRRAAGDAFAWKPLAPVAVKGKAETLEVYVLAGAQRRATRAPIASGRTTIGRAAELGAMQARLDDVLGGHGAVLALIGEAGIGKSHLITEFTGTALDQRVFVARGECQSYGRNASYFVWRAIWTALFGLDDDAADDARVAHLERTLADIDADLVTRAPLLAGLLDLPLPANDLTASFDAKLRKTSLETLLVQCLCAKTRDGPLALILEDCHWLDPLSRDLLEALVRSVPGLPVLFLLAYRPESDVRLGIETLPCFQAIALNELDQEDSVQLVRERLRQMVGEDAEPSAALAELVTSRAQGNPFYIEELFNYIGSQGIDPRDERALKGLALPESLHSLILSRVDRLDEAPRQILKVASVVGRVFRTSALPGVYPELGGLEAIREELRRLASADLVQVESDEAEETYVFKHIVTREVAYESMPFGFRSLLHERVGDYIEETEGDGIERNLDLLAHHYWHSGNRDKKREYLGRAGAAAQSGYANAVAIDYFERLVPLLSKGSRLDVLLKLGKVQELVGNWRRAQEVDGEALAIAEDLDDGLRRASCQTALAEVVRKQGHFKESLDLLNRAARGFASFGEETGVARVLHLVGTVWAQRGNYDKALESYNKSLKIRERIGDKAGMASLLSNRGVVAEHRGDYDAARGYHERALTLRESVGDRWAIGVSMTNLGMIAFLQHQYGNARGWFDKSMALNREIGDAWMVATCHNNLGNATRGLGDYAAARNHYAESLRVYRDYDDCWALAFLLEDIGVLAALCGDPSSALELIGAVDAIREAIGAPRAPALEQEMERQLAPVVAGMPEEERAACRVRGRALDVTTAIGLALSLCSGA